VTSKINYEIGGGGPRLVLLHPVGLDLTFLRPVAEILRKDFTVLTPDQRGHGKSAAAAPDASLETYADDLYGLLTELKFPPAAVGGFSFGGMVTQAFALKYPAVTSAVIICACGSQQSPQRRAAARARADDARRGGIQAVLDVTLDRWFTPAFRAAGKDAPAKQRLLADDVEGWARAWYAIGDLDTLPRLPSIRAPTLCVAGELDQSVPPPTIKAIADAIPGARYEIIAGAPHMLFIEQPEATARLIGNFLKGVV
jgi:3-oxoadipate enol-lactonase